MITHQAIAEGSGLPADNSIFDVAQVLNDSHLIELKTMGGLAGHVTITAAGVREAERVIQAKEESGQPRYSTIIVMGDQQLRAALEPLVSAVREQIDSLGSTVDVDTRADLASDLDSANDQLRAARPNRGVIKAALERINTTLSPLATVTASVAAIAGSIAEVLHGLGL